MTPTITHYRRDDGYHFQHIFEIDGHPYGRWLSDARRKMLEWVIDSGMDYGGMPDGSSIFLTSDEDATLFKLRWMGSDDA